jgi:hypothetical protein
MNIAGVRRMRPERQGWGPKVAGGVAAKEIEGAERQASAPCSKSARSAGKRDIDL